MKMAPFINDLMGGMTLKEKVVQLNLSNAVTYTPTGPTACEDVEMKMRTGNVAGIQNSAALDIV